MNFDQAKAHKEVLSNVAANVSKKLNEFPRGPSGLVSDEIRESYEYRLAKAEYEIAAKLLREFNAFFVKKFKKELDVERKAKYAAGTINKPEK